MRGLTVRAVIARTEAGMRSRQAAVAANPDDPLLEGADVAPRPTPRQEAFDHGEPPLPAYATIPPRRGWTG